ncbi:MAG: hypothetical protein FJX74_12445 [Armatimonadetes bacterium]|nr:hypothetical protein [Armatimonadota bacterium]
MRRGRRRVARSATPGACARGRCRTPSRPGRGTSPTRTPRRTPRAAAPRTRPRSRAPWRPPRPRPEPAWASGTGRRGGRRRRRSAWGTAGGCG